MKRVFLALGAGIAAYVIFAFLGGFLISVFSSNSHDLSMEAAMTGAFVTGPIGAIIGAIFALRASRAK